MAPNIDPDRSPLKTVWKHLHSPIVLPTVVVTATTTAIIDLPLRVSEFGWAMGLVVGGLVLLSALISLLDMLPLGICWIITLVRVGTALLLAALPLLERARSGLTYVTKGPEEAEDEDR